MDAWSDKWVENESQVVVSGRFCTEKLKLVMVSLSRGQIQHC